MAVEGVLFCTHERNAIALDTLYYAIYPFAEAWLLRKAIILNFALPVAGGIATTRTQFLADRAGLPRIASSSHIVPLHVGKAALCTEVSQRLLSEFSMYATPINYPTVPRGEERLRFTPGPLHTDEMMDALTEALIKIVPLERRRAA